jgi:type IX secretion system PorP/SprF family membrane protein
MKKRLLVAITMFICLYSQAQDPHFSQYFTSPMTLNPALIGKGIADWRALANFRSQWWGSTDAAPFTTFTASLEKNFRSGIEGKSVFGLGVSMLSDRSNSGLLQNNFFTMGAAYNIALDGKGNELLGVGIEGTYANRMVDAGKFQFQSQFGSMGFQRSSPSGDPVSILSNHYWDVNVGLHYSAVYPVSKWGYQLGVAVYHTGTPQEGVFSSTTYSIARRVSLQGGLVFYLNNGDEVNISAINESQGQNSIFTLGGVYKTSIKSGAIESLHLGLWNRFRDALYPYIGIESKNWLIGVSYDVINSEIRNSYNSVQSMEFSFAWHFSSVKKAGLKSQRVLYY